jgi:4-alpha-glucanotransferase
VRAYLPPGFDGKRFWGFGINLYALRSQRNWGIGDFTDLSRFVRYAGSVGADFVGLNPLHALHYTDPEAASPYAPASRYFRNPIYIDVEAVPEFTAPAQRAAALRERVRGEAFGATLGSLRAEPYVAYARVARAKWSAFEELYGIFREQGGARREAFSAFVERGGERLERFAAYQALAERFTARGRRSSWFEWPSEYRDPANAAVAAWTAQHRRRLDYFKYLQWIADEQLCAVAAEAGRLTLGLYLDMAVGVDPDSADVWSDQAAYALHETIGAPPDPLGPLGQNWGLPAPDIEALLRNGGTAFSQMLSSNMAHAGILRLDHVMALLRLFRIPRGKTAAEGAYVDYPFEDLLALVISTSHSARSLIVGEDLGNVPAGFRERMETAGVLSYRLLLFERDDAGGFLAPHAYPALALATATTHDLPTLAGWTTGRDIAARERIGLLPAEAAQAARTERRVEVTHLLEALRSAGELEDGALEALHRAADAQAPERDHFEPLIRAAYRFLARTPARLVLVQLDDALGEFDQVNLPGTVAEYPNWRRKNGLDLDEIIGSPRLAEFSVDVDRRVKGGLAS